MSIFFILYFALFFINTANAEAVTEINSSVVLEQRFFPQDAQFDGQKSAFSAVKFSSEFYYESANSDNRFIIEPFVRLDSTDNSRNIFDFQELVWSHSSDFWEFNFGITSVFWGQTESIHLVDIINQTDIQGKVDGEDKLGQPMANLSWENDWGTSSLFLLPFFRERKHPGEEGRFRFPIIVSGEATYESAQGQSHMDFAFRWQKSLGDWELGASYFEGTSRTPQYMPITEGENTLLQAHYQQIQQIGIDLLAVKGNWLLKAESLYRKDSDMSYLAFVGGFEYLSYSPWESDIDIGWLLEYQFDDRGTNSFSIAQNDLMFGSRFSFNNELGTSILIAFIQDLDNHASRYGFIESSSRINDNFKWELEAWFFKSNSIYDPLYSYKQDNMLQFSLHYYF